MALTGSLNISFSVQPVEESLNGFLAIRRLEHAQQLRGQFRYSTGHPVETNQSRKYSLSLGIMTSKNRDIFYFKATGFQELFANIPSLNSQIFTTKFEALMTSVKLINHSSSTAD